MREIKFRAWDETRGMSDPFHITTTRVHFRWSDGELRSGYNVDDLGNLPLMQFTGLLDKNKVEIYENDILRCTIDGEAYARRDVVEFTNGAFRMRYRTVPVYEWEMTIDSHELEVIGNTLQNPDLLTPTDTEDK